MEQPATLLIGGAIILASALLLYWGLSSLLKNHKNEIRQFYIKRRIFLMRQVLTALKAFLRAVINQLEK